MDFFLQEYFAQKMVIRDICQDSRYISEEANTKLTPSTTRAKIIQYLKQKPYSLTLIHEFFRIHTEINLPPSYFSYNLSRFQSLHAVTPPILAKMTRIKTLAKVTDINSLAKMTDIKKQIICNNLLKFYLMEIKEIFFV